MRKRSSFTSIREYSAKLAVRLLIAVALLSVGSPLLNGGRSCDSDLLNHSFQQQPGSAAQAASRMPGAWREIKTVVVLPSEFSRDPVTDLPNGMSREELIADAQTSIAMANEYLRPLKLVIRIAEFHILDDRTQDPFESAVRARSPYNMLHTAIHNWGEYDTQDYDLVLLLARRYFRGKHGLAYPAVSCLSQQYSVVFATQGGPGARLRYGLAHTIAHEVGHYLGMSHDDEPYAAGAALMASRFSLHPFGFSEESLEQARRHSGEGMQGGSCFRALAPGEYGLPNDSDGDGAADSLEAADGSDPLDAGSYRSRLKSPVHALWNSFLNTINILELVNRGSEELQAAVSLYSLDGALEHTVLVPVPPEGQYDLIVNELPGFIDGSYGLLEIAFEGELDGRMSYYRMNDIAQFYEFAFSIPLLQPRYGRTLTTFNTHQPSRNPNEFKHAVLNWLTIVNLHEKQKLFRVTSFDNSGQVLRSIAVSVPGRGRKDVDGGHLFAGSGTVGSHIIHPDDPAAPYAAQLVRYSSNASLNEMPSGYHFAYPLSARAGTGRVTYLPVSGAGGEENWVELANSLSRSITVDLQLLGQDGSSAAYLSIPLGPFEQQHINAGAILREQGRLAGIAAVAPSIANAVTAQSMHYVHAPGDGSVTAMYAVPAAEPLGNRSVGSYNLFLGTENRLRLANTTSTPIVAAVSANVLGEIRTVNVPLGANQSMLLPLQSITELGIRADTYGLLQVDGAGIIAGVLRRRTASGRTDLAMPTAMR